MTNDLSVLIPNSVSVSVIQYEVSEPIENWYSVPTFIDTVSSIFVRTLRLLVCGTQYSTNTYTILVVVHRGSEDDFGERERRQKKREVDSLSHVTVNLLQKGDSSKVSKDNRILILSWGNDIRFFRRN